jgi:predicted RNase H-like HicB family nuclease
MKIEKKVVAYYLGLPYTRTLRADEDGDVVAKIVELPGCSAHGADEQEALRNLEEAQRLWIEDCVAAGDAVPEPAAEGPLPSGKWVQRVPRSLHRRLSQMAKEEGVSLNQLVTSMLSQQLSGRAMQKALGPMVVSSGSSLRHPRAAD